MSPHKTSEPTREEQRQELARILESPGIARSANLVRLLTFVCEKQFEGKTDELRESSIAVHALGRRPGDFDPQIDPIVRVTARTLRQRLADYYRAEGGTHDVELVLPTGQYVPHFVRRKPVARAAPETTAGPVTPDHEAAAAAARAVDVTAPPTTAPLRGARRGMRTAGLVVAGVAACALGFWAGRATLPQAPSGAAAPCPCGVWGSPVWSDEFDGPKGALPDPATWAYDVGGGGWGNGEVGVYCDPHTSWPSPCSSSQPNAYLDGGGNLVIEARRQGGNWTSARLKTMGLRELEYGRIEARMRLPVGAGLWPAFWLLGADIERVGWPQSGSITVAENVPERPNMNGLGPTGVRSTLHGPGYFGGNGLWQNFTLPSGGRIDDEAYHVYGAIWSPEMVQFYVDDVSNVFFVVTPSQLPTGGRWVFDHPFFILLNLAVGGHWPGPPEASTPDLARILVDYVRHYRPARVPGPRMAASAIAVRTGETVNGTVRLTSTIGTGHVSLSCSGAPAGSACTLSPPVVDFTSAAVQAVTLSLATATSSGPSRVAAAPGRYGLRVTAVTVSGDKSTVDVPVTIGTD
jgi:beta-glucanase (GH16 family)